MWKTKEIIINFTDKKTHKVLSKTRFEDKKKDYNSSQSNENKNTLSEDQMSDDQEEEKIKEKKKKILLEVYNKNRKKVSKSVIAMINKY